VPSFAREGRGYLGGLAYLTITKRDVDRLVADGAPARTESLTARGIDACCGC
jgi:hypothetical protein